MGVFFGTDGIRGIVNEDLTFDIAKRVGNALTCVKNKPVVIIGADTRISGSYIMLGVAGGATAGGATVIDVGVVPTAGIAFLTKELNADFGVVISASHNSAEYNGIKVFDKRGYKLVDKEEENLERFFMHEKVQDFPQIGAFTQDLNAYKRYEKHLIESVKMSLKGLSVVLDGSNGAAHKIAPQVFRSLGATVYATNCKNDGIRINDNCGSLYPQQLAKKVLKYKADIGFAFDGDADRVIGVDENGCIFDGDMMLYTMATQMFTENKLKGNVVVGTTHTNMGLQVALERKGISLLRANIGDKYVLAKMVENNYNLGGEQSGHIIMKDFASTGDGILTALQMSEMLIANDKKLSQMFDAKLYPQVNINIKVNDKLEIMNNENVISGLNHAINRIGDKGRVMLRASGTEPKI
ncbi:MAG: phosphoglucosamine mutase, partial [Clostridia bacterium]